MEVLKEVVPLRVLREPLVEVVELPPQQHQYITILVFSRQ
jgi:hypothetical protein